PGGLGQLGPRCRPTDRLSSFSARWMRCCRVGFAIPVTLDQSVRVVATPTLLFATRAERCQNETPRQVDVGDHVSVIAFRFEQAFGATALLVWRFPTEEDPAHSMELREFIDIRVR